MIDARLLGDFGIGTYLRNLIPRVIAAKPAWQFVLLGSEAACARLPGVTDAPNVSIRSFTSSIYGAREQWELAGHTRGTARPDLFWAPHYNIPLAYSGRLVVTVHDVLHLAHPELLSGPLARVYARTMFRAVRARADAILCVSQFTRNELLRLVPSPNAGAPRVVLSGVEPAWHQPPTAPPSRPRPYILWVGTGKPHKNLRVLLEAFTKTATQTPHDLVLVADADELARSDERVATALRELGSRVSVTGRLSFDQLRAHVAGASLFVLPSLYEGFGMPATEAMASGCPCLLAESGSLPEIGGAAAEYFDPNDAASLSSAMTRLVRSPERLRQLRDVGRARSAGFTWEQCASETVSVLEGVVRERQAERAPVSGARAWIR